MESDGAGGWRGGGRGEGGGRGQSSAVTVLVQSVTAALIKDTLLQTGPVL